MSDTVDVTLMVGLVQETAREVRLLRLQTENLASRFAGMEQRLAVMEQSFHELVGEISRGFGQMQQQMTRQERRLDAVDAGLSSLREGSAKTVEMLQELLLLGRRET
jgi:hypothetical protein